MKHVVSVSLGSSTRDHRVETVILGKKFLIERIGVNGDYEKFLKMVADMDGKVDAIGIGGISLFLPVKDRTYIIRSAIPLAKAAKKTPVADGSTLREILEPQVVFKLNERLLVDFQGRKAMITCAVDRYGMTLALAELGCGIVCADMIFALGIPFTVHSIPGLQRLARFVAPTVTKLPFDMLYPTGQREERVENPHKYASYYRNADIIAGDFNYIKRYMPDDLDGKVVITNTVTMENIEELRSRGVSMLVTTTPEYEGRSFGTNVMEAVISAVREKHPIHITRDEYLETIEMLGLEPRIVKLR